MMDRRSWPWKKKSSDKTVITTDSSTCTLSNSGGNQADQDVNSTVKYVQISAESYAHLTELEGQVKILQEKLSAAQTEMTTKDNLVKQHAKVAEEAVSGTKVYGHYVYKVVHVAAYADIADIYAVVALGTRS